VHEGVWKVVRAEDQCVGVPRLADTNRGVLTTSESYMTRRALSGWVSTADCRRPGAERSRLRWLTSTPIDWLMVTGEHHLGALDNGGG